jgi:hypothetical protein
LYQLSLIVSQSSSLETNNQKPSGNQPEAENQTATTEIYFQTKAFHLKDYVDNHKQLPSRNAPEKINVNLARWVQAQKNAHRNGKLPYGREDTLRDIYPNIFEDANFEKNASLLKECYYHENKLPSRYDANKNNVTLAGWLARQQKSYRDGKL